jgi:hypothetical protein
MIPYPSRSPDKIFKIFKEFLPTFKPCETSSILVAGTATVVVSKQGLDDLFTSGNTVGGEWVVPCGVQLAGSSFPDN